MDNSDAKIMEEAWICVDGHGDERIFPCKPYRNFPNMDLEVMWGNAGLLVSMIQNLRQGSCCRKELLNILLVKN